MSKRSGTRRIFGVDFSGAADTARRLWIAEGRVMREKLRLLSCAPIGDLIGERADRAACHRAFVDLIANSPDAIFGCDFPFGLPEFLMAGRSWQAFAADYHEKFLQPEDFRDHCRKLANGTERRRVCDREARVPFAAYNLRIYRQTFYGIRDVLAAAILRDAAAVVPMQAFAADRAWIVEACPASTLKALDLYRPYKGADKRCLAQRRRILRHLEEIGWLAEVDGSLRSRLLSDAGGDALDSVIAAAATMRAYTGGKLTKPPSPLELVEGRIIW
ncbi:MAG TPA: DUF429 domain-containing protein [Dongiaceae bacterium]